MLIDALLWILATALLLNAEVYDVVIRNGRVIDPETKLDAVRNLGLRDGKVAAISTSAIQGKRVIEARGLIVAPGFIDLHWHGREPASDRYEVMDGVTSSLELEIGTADVDGWYRARRGKSIIHHGVSAGHPPIRMEVLHDTGDFLPADQGAFANATDEDIAKMRMRLEQELKKGAVAVGFGIAYTQSASYWEILEMFRIAARYGASCHVHMRGASSTVRNGSGPIQGLSEVIAAASITGAPLHIVHINSSSQGVIDRTLQIIGEARQHGLDITTEAYPYTAGATRIESALFDDYANRPDIDFSRLQWVATGERLTRESFLKYRKERGTVIIHSNTEANVRKAVSSPLTMIASDGFDITANGHPRSAGTFTKVLRQYVREEQTLTWMDALSKMTDQPAKRLQRRVPAMKFKGRLQVGADADIVVFDPETVRDMSTYERPQELSAGMKFVLVDGTLVVDDGKNVPGVFPGKPIRANIQ
jgi:N-acyl-D-aspartate/D-glutamate deacylase